MKRDFDVPEVRSNKLKTFLNLNTFLDSNRLNHHLLH